MTPLEQIQEKIITLGNMLEEDNPGFPTWLRDIHKQLKADEEIVTLLSEEEINTVVSGLSKQVKVVITESAVKAAKGKSIKSMTVDDL